MPALELRDIQGIILRGYAELNNASFLLLRIDDGGLAKRWLKTLELRNAVERPRALDSSANIAFTPSGLKKLGLTEELRSMFSNEFNEGMSATAHRRRILGDHGDSDPRGWRWGGPANEPADILLMLYAFDEAALQTFVDGQIDRLVRHGLGVIDRLDSLTLPDRKEHFGFREGISQPDLEGFCQNSLPGNSVAAGEFLFGHPNAYGQYTDRPTLPAQDDPAGLLSPAPDHPSRRDLGMNGSYLVFRQLRQHVSAFWNYCAEKARAVFPSDNTEACVSLASKMVGRWPSGAPLVKAPHGDTTQVSDDNDFLYVRSGDADGLRCPIGSHVRRSNPRDSLDPEPGSDRSTAINNRHRIIRRGRAYGPPAAASMDPRDIIGKPDDERERGLHFICFNTQIGRQFEFIQQTWLNSPKFEGLYEDDDPLVGDRGGNEEAPGGTFTIQRQPVRKRITGMPRFVTVRGGGYFFMPGISAVRYLASLK